VEAGVAKYGSNSLAVHIDDTEGGSLTDISQHVTAINGVEVEALMEESYAFGDSWFESLATGVRKMNDVVIEGFYDDTASTGPNAILVGVQDSPADGTRTFRVTWGGSKTTTVEVWIAKYTRMATRGQLTKYSATLRPTGAVTEA
jgi:hypothetical protein